MDTPVFTDKKKDSHRLSKSTGGCLEDMRGTMNDKQREREWGGGVWLGNLNWQRDFIRMNAHMYFYI